MNLPIQIGQNTDILCRQTGVDPRQWVINYADYLFAFAISRVNNEDLAKDLVQDTFLSGLERIHGFEGRSSEKTWLTSILKNKIYDTFRANASSSANHQIHPISDYSGNEFFNQGDGHWQIRHRPRHFSIDDPDAVGNKEFYLILQRCLKKMPAAWRDIFTMRYMDEEKANIICRELDITAANFWVIVHRSKVSLRACLQKNWR